MTIFELLQELNPLVLTVEEQVRTRENDPTLSYPTYFPAQNVESVKLATITEVDSRLVSDRREWNADGRYIPTELPPAREWEMVPLEDWFAIDEHYIQLLGERFLGDTDRILAAAKARISDQVSNLTDSNIRANEWESIRAWVDGEIPVMNPQTGNTYTAPLNFDAARYNLDGTAWSDTNAFDQFVTWAQEAENFVGPISGARMRRDIALLIAASAPTIGANSIRMTLTQVQDYLSQSLGTEFMIWTDERVYHKFTGAGNTRTPQKVFPADTVAFVPSGGRIGNTYQAPIYRAEDISAASIPDSVDMNGQRIFYIAENAGKSLKVQAQANWLAIPSEQNVFIVNITQA